MFEQKLNQTSQYLLYMYYWIMMTVPASTLILWEI